MKRILLIGTGGTIASRPSSDGLVPALSSDELITTVPEIATFCEVDCIQVLNMDSTNIKPEHWIMVAEKIQQNYDLYDGFVITHGTDTMAYTAAGLSYLVQNSRKPIVLTGAQIPVTEENSDARRNLIDAFLCACDERSKGVVIVFSGSVIIGTRARKNYTKRFAAFESINYPEIARIQSERITWFIPQDCSGETIFHNRLNPSVGLLKLVPGMNEAVTRFMIDSHDGLIVESFGVGGLPEYSDFYELFKQATESGKTIVMTTQGPNDGSDLGVYHVGHRIKQELKVLEAHDMTSETALAKLMWVLGQTNEYETAKRLFETPVAHDSIM